MSHISLSVVGVGCIQYGLADVRGENEKCQNFFRYQCSGNVAFSFTLLVFKRAVYITYVHLFSYFWQENEWCNGE